MKDSMIPKASDFSPLDHYQLMKTCIEAGNCSSLSDRNLTKEELVSSLREAITTGPGIPNVNKRLVEMKTRKFIQLPDTLLTFTTPIASISTSATFFSEAPQTSCSYANPLSYQYK